MVYRTSYQQGNPMKLMICNLAGTYLAVFDPRVNSRAGHSTRWLNQSDFFEPIFRGLIRISCLNQIVP